jgi:hypothetical protein
MIVTHWRKLEGPVHPEDAPYFDDADHTFNLDWPPPAYIGDVIGAPFVLLMMNGGYDPHGTPREFYEPSTVAAYLDRLHNPGPADLGVVAPYYARANYFPYIADGRLALVNAIAYRSGKLSKEPRNQKLAERLPSTLLHRRWLREELIPQAREGVRTIIAHRHGMWNLHPSDREVSGMLVTKSGASPHLPEPILSFIKKAPTASFSGRVSP